MTGSKPGRVSRPAPIFRTAVSSPDHISSDRTTMPLLFVHGVNNRASDCDYFQDRGMRREMFDRLVASELRERFPGFAVLDEAYWGDLGVKYNWGLQSVPSTAVLKSLGPGEETLAPAPLANAELLELLEEFTAEPVAPAPPPGVDVLGVGSNLGLLVVAARQALGA